MDRQGTLLVIDDSLDIQQAVAAALRPSGYDFRFAENGRVGLAMAFSEPPDLIVCDMQLPELHGTEVVSRLKTSLVTRHVPILVLTADDGPDAVVRSLEAGADDYVRKPFHPRELQARVAMLLRRTRNYVGTDSLTKLPGNALLREEMQRRLEAGQPMAVCYIDLDEFKAYVDTFGFEPASRVIQQTARICYNEMVEVGCPDDFIGHIGGDDFVVVTTPQRAPTICEGIIRRFEEQRGGFYSDEVVAAGYFRGHDRSGAERDFPLMTITIAVLLPTLKQITDLTALAEEAARCKQVLKSLPGSNWRMFDD